MLQFPVLMRKVKCGSVMYSAFAHSLPFSTDHFAVYCELLQELETAKKFCSRSKIEDVVNVFQHQVETLSKKLRAHEAKHSQQQLVFSDQAVQTKLRVVMSDHHKHAVADVVGIASQLLMMYPLRYQAGKHCSSLYRSPFH